jgi:hypothetical protein
VKVCGTTTVPMTGSSSQCTLTALLQYPILIVFLYSSYVSLIQVIRLHGADALRYSLVTGSAPGNDVPLAMEKIEGNR